MKKFYFIAFLLTSTLSFSQLSENFDASATLPAGWTTFIGTNGLGTEFNWTTSTVRYASANNSAFVRYEAGTGGPTQDWLVTPLVDLTDYTGNSLTFSGGEQYTTVYASVYTVRVSTTSASDIASFTTVATYDENDFSGSADGVTLLASDLKTVDLAAYDGQQIYVAFVLEQNDDDNWFVDDVSVSGTLSVQEFDASQISMFPNPTNGLLTVSSKTTLSKIEIFNILGKRVKMVENSNDINLSELSAGAYIARITAVDGKTINKKIIKN